MTTRHLLLFLLIVVLWRGATHAQVVEVKGGDSTMFDAAGGNVILHFPNSTETFGAGIADGRLHLGISSSFDSRQWSFTAGDAYLGFAVGTGLAVPVRGLTAVRKWKKQKLTVFTGAVGQFYSFPYFS